jgi:hypothetical protein
MLICVARWEAAKNFGALLLGLQRYEAGKVIEEETEIVVEVSYGN